MRALFLAMEPIGVSSMRFRLMPITGTILLDPDGDGHDHRVVVGNRAHGALSAFG